MNEMPKEKTQVTAVANTTLTSLQFTMLLDMVKGLQFEVIKMQQQQADRQMPDSRDNPARPAQPTCWRCGTSGHVRRQCPRRERMLLNIRGSW